LADALAIETALIGAWPALEIVRNKSWEARFAEGYSGRSNSIQTLDPTDGDKAQARIASLAALYAMRGITPAFKVTPMTGAPIIAALDALGWALWHQSLVLTMPLGDRKPADPAVVITAPTDPQWLNDQARLQGYGDRTKATLATLLARLGPAAGLTLLVEDGTPAASALAVREGEYCAFFNVVTDPGRRRQGLGRAIMEAALGWAAGQSAKRAAIQVQADNAAATALYHGLGFTLAYPYHYRRPKDAQ